MDPFSDKPRRRIVMVAEIQADDWDALERELYHLSNQIAMNGKLSTSSVSGGYSTGHIIATDESGDITHNSWATELTAWLEARKEAP